MIQSNSPSAGNKTKKAHILALLTIFIWGTTYISTKRLLVDFSPTEIMFFRFIIAFVVLFVVSPSRIRIHSLKEELLFASAGLTGVTMYFSLQNTSLVYTLASNAGVLISVAPFFTGILSWLILKDTALRRNFFIGFAFSIIGVILISFNGNFVLKLNPLGDILAVSCAVAWAAYCVIMKKISALDYPTIPCTRKIFFYGILTMLPLLPFLNFHLDLSRFYHLPNVYNMLFLGLGASALCFVTWNYAVRVLGPVRTSFYIYFNPIVTVVTSAIILQERITPVAMAGVVLILSGLYLSEKRSKKSSQTEKEELQA